MAHANGAADYDIEQWSANGVALDLNVDCANVKRTSATQYTVSITAKWRTHWDTATDYGMKVTSGGVTKSINTEGTKSQSGSGTFTGTYSIGSYGAATRTILVTFENYNTYHNDSASKTIKVSVDVPAWTSYTIKYNANGGTGAPSAQTKYKDVDLTLSSSKPTRSGYTFAGWATSSTGSVAYSAGATYKSNESVTLNAKWTAGSYTVSYNANGGTGAPAAQTKTHGVDLKLSSTKPTRTNYTFKGWGTSPSSTTVSYTAGGTYSTNASTTLYAIWSQSYTPPRITNLSVRRCNTSKVVDDAGTNCLILFNYAIDKNETPTFTVRWRESTSTTWTGSTSPTDDNNDGKISTTSVGHATYGNKFSVEKSYVFEITVADSGGSTTKEATMTSSKFAIDVKSGCIGLAFGKAANTSDTVTSAWSIGVGNKEKYGDPNAGVLLHKEGYMHIQRSSTNGKPYIGFLVDTDQTVNGSLTLRAAIKYNKTTDQLEFLDAGGYLFGDNIFTSNVDSASGVLVIGEANYDRGNDTYIMGNDTVLWSSAANKSYFIPYYRKGNSVDITLETAGFVTSASKDVSFMVPLSKPIIGSPTITATSVDGFKLRQGGLYTHGSGSSTNVSPSSYTATMAPGGVRITATFSNITNVTNNDSIGVRWSGKITFS